MKAIIAFVCVVALGSPGLLFAQSPNVLSLDDARARARSASQGIVAGREALNAARGREMQAGAFPNPTLSLSAERIDGGSDFNRQQVIGFDQRLELGGQRSARIEAAQSRSKAAEARLQYVVLQTDFDVVTAYARAVSGDRRAALSRQSAAAFREALRVSEQRLAAGDISLYTHRRLKLEAARYAALEAQANLERKSARILLSSLMNAAVDSTSVLNAVLVDSLPVFSRVSIAELLQNALRARADLKAIGYEVDALTAESSGARAERIPVPVVSGGYKTEQTAGTDRLSGFAASVSVSLSLWDRRRGAIQSADAESRRAAAELEGARRRVVQDVTQAYEAFVEADMERALLAPQLGAESAAALRSVQTAYNEGDITLLEWLDAVRAYNEAESAYATLLAEVRIRRAAMDRVAGVSANTLNPENK